MPDRKDIPANAKNKENIFRRRPFAKYMQVKLAITVLLISLALFALVYVLYRIVNENNERYNKDRIIPETAGVCQQDYSLTGGVIL